MSMQDNSWQHFCLAPFSLLCYGKGAFFGCRKHFFIVVLIDLVIVHTWTLQFLFSTFFVAMLRKRCVFFLQEASFPNFPYCQLHCVIWCCTHASNHCQNKGFRPKKNSTVLSTQLSFLSFISCVVSCCFIHEMWFSKFGCLWDKWVETTVIETEFKMKIIKLRLPFTWL